MVLRDAPTHTAPFTYDVCAIGDAIVDVIADCEESFLVEHNIVKGAMTLIDEDRAVELYRQFGPAVEMSGGSVANTAAGIANLGGKPAYIGRVRNDQLGEIFRHDLNAAGVHFSTSPATEGPATGRCLILVTPDAQRSMNTFLGAASEFTVDDLDPKVIAASQLVFLEGYLFDKPAAKKAFYRAAKIAHEASRQLAITLSDTFCVERHRDDFAFLVREEADILIANEKELMVFYQVRSFSEAMAAAREQVRIVVGTRSEKGAVIASGNEIISIPAEPVAKVVDTTGAGDLFAAGFLFGVTHGLDLTTSGALGAITASEIISHYGPRAQCDLKALVREKGVRL